LFTALLYALIFGTPGNAPLGQIVRADFQLYVVALYNSYIVKAELAGNVRGNNVTVRKFNFEICVGQAFQYLALGFYNVVFRHYNSLTLTLLMAFVL
jgi:hypothetical protein